VYPDSGFGVPARILSGPGVTDPREVVTIGFVDVEPARLEHLGERVLAAERRGFPWA
jgi:hypothetical protein